MKKIIFLLFPLIQLSTTLCAQVQTSKVTDVDGNVYKTVKIGDYWWMAENLKVKHYNNADTVTQYIGTASTSANDYVAYWSYPNNDAANGSTYGLNYSWSAATNAKGLCPSGWELPDTSVWYSMARAFGVGSKIGSGTVDAGWTLVGKYLKATSNWASPTTASAAIDSVGFNALPSGDLNTTGFTLFGQEARFWTPNIVDAGGAGRRYMALNYNSDNLIRGQYRNVNHVCVRCVQKQAENAINETLATTSVSAYPNPATDFIIINTKQAQAGWTLYSLSGVAVLTGQITDYAETINLQSIPTGVYILHVTQNGSSKRLKIIKK